MNCLQTDAAAATTKANSAVEDKTDEDEDSELFLRLSECCEDAFANGLDSAEIFEALHSLPQQVAEMRQPKLENHIPKESKNQQVFKFRRIFFLLLALMRNLKKAGIGLICLTSVAFFLHITVCTVFLNVSPIKTLAVFLPSFLDLNSKSCLLPSHPIIMEMVRPILDCSICDDKLGSPVIIFESKPTKAEFLEVAYSSRPVIVKGKQSETRVAFNFTHLKYIFESEPGGVDSVSEDCQFLPLRSNFQTFREALETISNFSFKEGSNEAPWYIGWSNCHPGVAEKLRKLFPRPDFLPENSESSAIDWIFIGSPGLGAAMHIDYVRRPSWQLQLSGSKHWSLRPPPDCEHVCQSQISFTIYPGDLLFLETNSWYHETYIENDELSISIGSEYD